MEVLDISRIKEIRKQIKRLKDEEKKLLAPTMTDMRKVGEIVGIIKGNAKSISSYGQSNATTQKQAQIFIILYLYSPGTLIGDTMPAGLRNAIAKEVGASPPRISNIARDVRFLLTTYSDFREYVEYLWCEVQARLDLESSMGP